MNLREWAVLDVGTATYVLDWTPSELDAVAAFRGAQQARALKVHEVRLVSREFSIRDHTLDGL